MEQAYIHGQTFDKIDFRENYLVKGEYENCTFKNCDFSNSDLSNIKFFECGFIACKVWLN
ncbi:hypothetical protein EZS27_022035 [termite gut metagenome]|uniref:Pentapeptide repeat protein MfpA n=1 Tax=termite gut metagenome TaxID=433724 RepID=A0A5J4R564_9ZZZZ